MKPAGWPVIPSQQYRSRREPVPGAGLSGSALQDAGEPGRQRPDGQGSRSMHEHPVQPGDQRRTGAVAPASAKRRTVLGAAVTEFVDRAARVRRTRRQPASLRVWGAGVEQGYGQELRSSLLTVGSRRKVAKSSGTRALRCHVLSQTSACLTYRIRRSRATPRPDGLTADGAPNRMLRTSGMAVRERSQMPLMVWQISLCPGLACPGLAAAPSWGK